MDLSVREIQNGDIPHIIRYWTTSPEEHLRAMGVDAARLPSQEEWQKMLTAQINSDYCNKQSYCTIWLLDGKPAGHSNVNMITYGKQAHLHLHIWMPEIRGKGYGQTWLPLSLRQFYHKFELQEIYCEPASANPGPNELLRKTGFSFVKNYMTTPGNICFEQSTSQWTLKKADFLELYGSES